MFIWDKIRTQPAFIIGAINALVMIVGSTQLGFFNGDQAGALVIVINAVSAAATAFVTRPVAPSAFTALISAGVAFLMAYGIGVPGDLVAQLNAAVYPLLAFLTWGNVSPTGAAGTKVTEAPVAEVVLDHS